MPTANTAFVGIFERGPVDRPTSITSFGQFTSTFGSLNRKCKASYGVYQFFLNGGSVAYVVRVAGASKTATGSAKSTGKAGIPPDIELNTIGPGAWGNRFDAVIQPSQRPDAEAGWFDLVIREVAPPNGDEQNAHVVNSEVYTGLSAVVGDDNYVGAVLAHQSHMVTLKTAPGAFTPTMPQPIPVAASITNPRNIDSPENPLYGEHFTNGVDDFSTPSATGFGAEGTTTSQPTGFYSLDEIAPDVFNILCIPDMAALPATDWNVVFAWAHEYCSQKHFAFMIADPPIAAVVPTDPARKQISQMQQWFTGSPTPPAISNQTSHAAVYFPRIVIDDPAGDAPFDTECSGTLAGIYAKTDASRGVWKAPAGQDAVLTGVQQPLVNLSDDDNGVLNELGINCIRSFPVVGTVSWGARTIDGADVRQSEWRYINVRRLALYIANSVEQGTRWAVFEPNNEVLWSSLRESIGPFMAGLYREGALAGATPAEAYFVTCDSTTTTPQDQLAGRVNVTVAFAPVHPAEFVVLSIVITQTN